MAESQGSGPPRALRLRLSGIVQGVGFRPFVYRTARFHRLAGSVRNSMAGVTIEIAGPHKAVEAFRRDLSTKAPAAARIENWTTETISPEDVPSAGFRILPSDPDGGPPAPVIPADLATCSRCREELADPANPRYRYPFINCTECGPRFSIIEALPYDRANTTMRRFPLSVRSRREYEDPMDRRFHAEPNADKDSGPRLSFPQAGSPPLLDEAALRAAATALAQGAIVAVKGLGGFHLMVRADCPPSVQRLRQRKAREAKPLAVMFSSLQEVRRFCRVEPAAAGLLQDPAAPVVLLPKHDPQLWPDVSAFSTLGVLLPYTPLHQLLLEASPYPLVATSGNLSGEPICIENADALQRLGKVADAFLLHDRPIARPIDDSVADIVDDRPRLLRRSRGYAPLPLPLPAPLPRSVCLGGDLKNTVAVAWDNQVVLSQHIGDLANQAAEEAHHDAASLLSALFSGSEPQQLIHDAHPAYRTTAMATASGLPTRRVQHHEAHAWAALTEDDLLHESALCHVWDGTGYGLDGSIQGGESFLYRDGQLRRVACLRPFRLIGGDAAATQPWRPAMALLFQAIGVEATLRSPWPAHLGLAAPKAANFAVAFQRKLQSVQSSSMGRLFDAVSAFAGLASANRFEGEAAMRLEDSLDDRSNRAEPYPLPLDHSSKLILLDWQPLLKAVLADVQSGQSASHIAARFHRALTEAVLALTKSFPVRHVCLTGGCFQNRFLLQSTLHRLRQHHFAPHWPSKVPCNDGGLSYGQACAAALQPPPPAETSSHGPDL